MRAIHSLPTTPVPNRTKGENGSNGELHKSGCMRWAEGADLGSGADRLGCKRPKRRHLDLRIEHPIGNHFAGAGWS